MLVNMLECGSVVPGVFDEYPEPIEPKTIEAEVDRICRRNGVEVPSDEMVAILNRLNIDTVLAGDTLTCEIPTYRQDMETDADIAEEILGCTATIIFRLR